MSFANPASTAREDAASYTRGLLEQLGQSDPFEVLASTPARLEQAVRGLTVEQARIPEGPGKWSVGGVLQHLADTEIVYGYRIRMIVAHDTPEIEGYDQDLWATRLRYSEVPPAESLEQQRVLRAANLRMCLKLSSAELDRAGMHSERGAESVRRTLQLVAGHDLVHLKQIARIRAKVEQTPA